MVIRSIREGAVNPRWSQSRGEFPPNAMSARLGAPALAARDTKEMVRGHDLLVSATFQDKEMPMRRIATLMILTLIIVALWVAPAIASVVNMHG